VKNYFTILCGGSGTRLWPLSRKARPKQLLPFLNNKSLLEETIDRVAPLAQDKTHVGVITTAEQTPLIKQAVGEKLGFLLAEPMPRNTGPAILYSCLEIAKKDPEAVGVFLAADHFIPDTKLYCSYLQKAIAYAQTHDKIVTLGLMPTYPATGYGYIQASLDSTEGEEETICAGTPYNVKTFHEKPDAKKAQRYIEQADMFWNLGMFVGRISTFIHEFKVCAPEIFESVSRYVEAGAGYSEAPSLSIDYAVMEKSKNISVIPCDFEWTDVGNLETFLSIKQKYETKENNLTISIDGKNNIAQTNKKLVSFVGVDNLCVIEDGDVIVVAKRNEIEKVKEVRAALKTKLCEELM